MSMVDVRDVRLALRRRLLTTTGLPPIIQYDGHVLEGGPPSDAIYLNERFQPDVQRAVAFGVSEATGFVTYEVVAPASRPDLINDAYDLAHNILERFEHGFAYTDTDGTFFRVIRSQTSSTGRGTGKESDLYFVPAIVYWRSYSTLAF